MFFCTFGHNPTLFTAAPPGKKFLCGIQFMLGDLEATPTPGESSDDEIYVAVLF